MRDQPAHEIDPMLAIQIRISRPQIGALVIDICGQIGQDRPIGVLTGGVDFSAMKWVLKPGDDSDPKHKIAEVAIQYGAFINVVIQFLIIAFAIFLVVKAINRFTRREEAAPAPPPPTETLLTEIRDLLKQQR